MCRAFMEFTATPNHISGQTKVRVYCSLGAGLEHTGQHKFNPNFMILDEV